MADLLKITFYNLIKFIQAEIGTALMPFQYNLSNLTGNADWQPLADKWNNGHK